MALNFNPPRHPSSRSRVVGKIAFDRLKIKIWEAPADRCKSCSFNYAGGMGCSARPGYGVGSAGEDRKMSLLMLEEFLGEDVANNNSNYPCEIVKLRGYELGKTPDYVSGNIFFQITRGDPLQLPLF